MTPATAKIDVKKEFKKLYHASAKPALVELPAMNFLMMDGQGKPEDSAFEDAIQALYNLSYTLKFSFKSTDKPAGYFDYVVPPLEGLWWMSDNSSFDMARTEDVRWSLMIMQPAYIDKTHVGNAISIAKSKHPEISFERVRFEKYEEGLCIQLLHIGPYNTEAPDIERLHQHALQLSYELHGKHHEIYLSDPRKTTPDKLRTILRQPIRKDRRLHA